MTANCKCYNINIAFVREKGREMGGKENMMKWQRERERERILQNGSWRETEGESDRMGGREKKKGGGRVTEWGGGGRGGGEEGACL